MDDLGSRLILAEKKKEKDRFCEENSWVEAVIWMIWEAMEMTDTGREKKRKRIDFVKKTRES
ncbi:hypothetical protein HanIR_Chr08g0363991 [Helianthus annuus]|nr:hypothetical protein HanIR_Chr08g0363991 [Helianthus annuus]